ncbi:nucleotidyltransferase family protein [Alteromonas sp. ASW11-19]|uniref:Nucleotidyltransferase family protein n=1 Tax=Alteromonas salexigens TaxID=2982530 RepID=A0ABT2VKR8_9ALTE|nr:nucleotidyltransferase family protein [Alteromonas salexigens]MCU7553048.1 nucleotidyltransferase family protein [Alteromonas salexigens]
MAEQRISEAGAVTRTASLLKQDPWRWQCLQAAREQALGDWYIGAGFLRNAIWDACHCYSHSTPLNDVDLVYFNPGDSADHAGRVAEQQLAEQIPEANWQVRNQARMHSRHGHAPYQSAADAISRWIEVPTCVGVRLNNDDTLTFTAPFGLAQNWLCEVRINPDYPRPEVYRKRVQSKRWQAIWPALRVLDAG